MNEREEEYFLDWYEDNKEYLMKEFCEDNELYDNFVREEFDAEKKELLWERRN